MILSEKISKKNLIFLITVVLWGILITGIYIFNVRLTVKNGRVEPVSELASVDEIVDCTNLLEQELIFEQELRLNSIVLYLSPKENVDKDANVINVSLYNQNGDIVLQEEFDTGHIDQGVAWEAVFHEKCDLAAGKYTLELSSNEAEIPVNIWGTKVPSENLGELKTERQVSSQRLCIGITCVVSNAFLNKYYCVIVFFFLLTLAGGIYGLKRGIKTEDFYVIAALGLGILLMTVDVPYSYFDENAHVSAVYNYLDKVWVVSPEKTAGIQKSEEHEIFLREEELFENTGFTGLATKIQQYEYVYNNFFKSVGNDRYVSQGKFKLGYFYQYLPEIIGIGIARLLHWGIVPSLYFAQFCSLLFSVMIFRLAIKITPFKDLFTLLALTPVILRANASFSYDLFLNATIFLLIALLCDFIWGESAITMRKIIFMCFLAIVAVPPKIVYFPLLLLILLIPESGFVNKKLNSRVLFGITFGGVAAAIVIGKISEIVSTLGKVSSESIGPWGNQVYTYGELLEKPMEAFKLYFNTFLDSLPATIIASVQNMQYVLLPSWVSVAILIIVYAGIRNSYQYKISNIARVTIAAGLMMIYALFCFVALTWTTVGNHVIMGVQGRYLQPVLPMFFLLVKPGTGKERYINTNILLFLMLNIDLYCVMHMFRSAIL